MRIKTLLKQFSIFITPFLILGFASNLSKPSPANSQSYPITVMVKSNSYPRLAINAWEGARHGTVLRLHQDCVSTNPDCKWIYRDGMLISASNPRLAINAWEGALHGTVLRLNENCVSSNPDCTWTYQNGMFVSDSNPKLAINAWEGAKHGTVLRLHRDCVPTNPDCTWSRTFK